MRKAISLILTVPLLFALFSLPVSAKGGAKLYVNGVDISADAYVSFNEEEKYAEISFISVIEALGAQIVWKDGYEAEITLDGNVYDLNSNECVLHLKGRV